MTTEQRERAWRELENEGWEVFRDPEYVAWDLYDAAETWIDTFTTRDQAIDYALQLAAKEQGNGK